MSASSKDWPQDFEALAKQYWGAFGDFGRQASAALGAKAGQHGWQQAIDWWGQLAHGGREEANTVVEHFNRQMRGWFGLMQNVAGQFSGRDATATDVAKAWKQALGAVGENPFPELFRGLHGEGLKGLHQWVEDASPYLDAWRKEARGLLGMPAFGLAREHQERLQKLAQSQIDYQDKLGAYNALLAKAGQRAFELFEDKLAERSEPGRQIESARGLFDVWIDAAEEAYGEIALTEEFRSVYGEFVNAQMRLRAGVQAEVEQTSRQLGMPTRSELDGNHRKVHQLEREVRALKSRLVEIERGTSAGAGQTGTPRKPAPKSAGKPGPIRKAPAKTTAKKPVAKRAATKPAARKPAGKKKGA
jgi:polyhydroxyalkanoate synthase subunit PhaE